MTYAPNIWDFALASAVIAGNVVLDARYAVPLKRMAAEEAPAARGRTYVAISAFLWGFAACVCVLWLLEKRDWGLLYLNSGPTWRFGVGIALAIVVMVLLVMQRAAAIKRVRSDPDKPLSFGGALDALLPRTRGEFRMFTQVSVAAGVCEELIFRGFLLALLTSLFGLYAGAALSAALFGLCHAYQGVSGIIKTGLFGLVITLLVALTGSLIPAMIIHVVIDYAGGELSYQLVGDGRAAMLKAGAAS